MNQNVENWGVQSVSYFPNAARHHVRQNKQKQKQQQLQ